MYLQIIYQREALQMLKTIKQKVFQLAYKQVRYGFQKFSIKICTDKLCAAATVHFL